MVKATIITEDGQRFSGTNYTLSPQPKCPREGLPSGAGYHLCRTVCKQVGHAEVNALKMAVSSGGKLKGATLYLEGHTYACDNCTTLCLSNGIKEIVIGPPPG